MASIKDEVVVNLIGELPLLSSIVLDGLKEPAHLFLGYTLRARLANYLLVNHFY